MPTALTDPTALGRLVSHALAEGGGDVLSAWQRARDAIRDAAREDPADTAFATVICGSYLFYLADHSGVTHYSKTYQEHLANKRLYLGT